ncbi:MAG TPA: GspH/FimT family pseudopilin [Ramlibacter sp.]|nr:GspH/FimT family pseudopilin [Ramlibacter sp.]
MLVVMLIAAVLVTIAIPSMAAIIKSIKLSTASSAFVSYLHLARSEAIKRNSRVVLCKSADGRECSASGGWEQGLIVFHDANNNGTLDAGEAVIVRAEALPSTLKLVGNLNVSRYVSFAPTGATKLIGGGFQAGTLTLCQESVSAGEGRQIVLNAVGRPRVQKVLLNACA